METIHQIKSKQNTRAFRKEQWRFCPGFQNPADIPTRGMSANELLKSELWHHGPRYLQLPPDQWPTIDCLDNASANEELVEKTARNSTCTTSET